MHAIEPVAVMQSPYQEKFAIPRQPGLVPAAQGQVKLIGAYNNPHCLEGIDGFSHLWLSFIFHQTATQGWKPKVRPPRLGGNNKVGVFASRATFRPNALGLSVVKLEGVRHHQGHWLLDISGFDLLDQTPIVDIKPYVAYSDAISGSDSGFAPTPPALMNVSFVTQAIADTAKQAKLTELICQVLAQDPRPAYRKGKPDTRSYGMRLAHHNINWVVDGNRAIVTAVTRC